MLSTLCLAALGPLCPLQTKPAEPKAEAAAPMFAERLEAFFTADGEPLEVRTTCGSPAKDYIVEVNGGGLALADFDGDGDVDLAVVDGSTLERVRAGEPGFPPRLFMNRGDGTFEPAGPSWQMAGGRWGMGCATGDLDGDGWIDLVITEWGPDRVFLNQGPAEGADGELAPGRGFREITSSAGLAGERWGTSAALFDFDEDGVLDLFVANYLGFDPDEVKPRGAEGGAQWKGYPVMQGPEGLTPVHDQVYRGRGDGTFEALHARTVGFEPERAGYGLGMMPLDWNLDGHVDLYVANDSTPNFLWENQGDGTFRFVPAIESGAALDENGKEQAGMGIGAGDVNGDGRTDLLVTNFSQESNSLYLTRRRGFGDQADSFGVRGPSLMQLGWGTGLHDLDLDGDLDAFVLNGHVYPAADEPGTDTSYAQQDQIYLRSSAQRFDVAPLSASPPRVSRAGAAADLDGDGDLDIVALQVEGPVRVLVNRTIEPGARPAHAHWLRVALAGRAPNTAGLGARIVAEWEGGSQTAELFTSAGYQAARPPEVHFGLGPVARLERLTVHWPGGGGVSELADVEVDRLLVVEPPSETPSAEAPR